MRQSELLLFSSREFRGCEVQGSEDVIQAVGNFHLMLV